MEPQGPHTWGLSGDFTPGRIIYILTLIYITLDSYAITILYKTNLKYIIFFFIFLIYKVK